MEGVHIGGDEDAVLLSARISQGGSANYYIVTVLVVFANLQIFAAITASTIIDEIISFHGRLTICAIILTSSQCYLHYSFLLSCLPSRAYTIVVSCVDVESYSVYVTSLLSPMSPSPFHS